MNTLRTRFFLLPIIAAALPATAMATQECKFSEPRQLAFDTTGMKSVTFEVRQHTLRLMGVPGHAGALKGRACASSEDMLKQLTVTQERAGDRLVVHLGTPQGGIKSGLFGFGSHYAWLDLAGSVPASIPVRLAVGSGDAEASGLASLEASVGSGDLQARKVAGTVSATVGSGDLQLQDIGSLKVASVGSGDLKATDVRGDAAIDSIGSGDAELKNVGGMARIGSVGSGDLDILAARGGTRIGSIGSGDATLRNIGGHVEVGSLGSGDLDIDGLKGDLTVRSRGSGAIDHRGVTGRVTLPKR